MKKYCKAQLTVVCFQTITWFSTRLQYTLVSLSRWYFKYEYSNSIVTMGIYLPRFENSIDFIAVFALVALVLHRKDAFT